MAKVHVHKYGEPCNANCSVIGNGKSTRILHRHKYTTISEPIEGGARYKHVSTCQVEGCGKVKVEYASR